MRSSQWMLAAMMPLAVMRSWMRRTLHDRAGPSCTLGRQAMPPWQLTTLAGPTGRATARCPGIWADRMEGYAGVESYFAAAGVHCYCCRPLPCLRFSAVYVHLGVMTCMYRSGFRCQCFLEQRNWAVYCVVARAVDAGGSCDAGWSCDVPHVQHDPAYPWAHRSLYIYVPAVECRDSGIAAACCTLLLACIK